MQRQAIVPLTLYEADTMGYAFTFPLVKLLTRVPVGAYVHYPTIRYDAHLLSCNQIVKAQNRTL